ncbi:hypothetical protein WA026_009710, partial [Henosepilachna vigintioctopunctata]
MHAASQALFILGDTQSTPCLAQQVDCVRHGSAIFSLIRASQEATMNSIHSNCDTGRSIRTIFQ